MPRSLPFPVPEIGDGLWRLSKLRPLINDPECWSVPEGAILVVEDDRDLVLLKLLSSDPLPGISGLSLLSGSEVWVPHANRDAVESALRTQCRTRYAWLHLLCVRFDDPAEIEPFESAVIKMTGMALRARFDGHRHYDTSAMFSPLKRWWARVELALLRTAGSARRFLSTVS